MQRDDYLTWRGQLPRLGDKPEAARGFSGFAAAGCAQLGEDGSNVVFDSAWREKEAPGNLAVATAGGKQAQHLGFAHGHASGVGAGGRAWSARHAACATLE